MEEIIRSRVADFISLCRPLIREPGLIKRWKDEFGLVMVDDVPEIRRLDPRMEEILELQLTTLIHEVTHTKRPVVGVF